MECNGNVNPWRSRPGRFTCRAASRSNNSASWSTGAARSSTAPCRPTCRWCAAAARCTSACCASAATGTASCTNTSPAGHDFDSLPVPPLPDDFRRLANGIAASAGMPLDADLCILNYYDADGRMGLHQDKDESEALARGRASGRLGVARRHGAVSVRRACAAATPWTRSGSNRATRSSSAARRGCATTASRASCPAPRRRRSASTGRFNLTFRQY